MADINGYRLPNNLDQYRVIYQNPTLKILRQVNTGVDSVQISYSYIEPITEQKITGTIILTNQEKQMMDMYKSNLENLPQYNPYYDETAPTPIIAPAPTPTPTLTPIIAPAPAPIYTGTETKISDAENTIWSKMKIHIKNFLVGVISPIDTYLAMQDWSNSEIEQVRTDLQAKVNSEEEAQGEQDVEHQRAMTALEEKMDLLKKSILEKMGLFQSPEEKRVQAEILRQEFMKEMINQIPETALSYTDLMQVMDEQKAYFEAIQYQIDPYEPIIKSKDTTQAFLDALPLIAGVGLVGLLITRSKR